VVSKSRIYGFLSRIQNIAIIATLYISYQAYNASSKVAEREASRASAETMLKYSELIDNMNGHDGRMMVVIHHDLRLLKDKGGQFATDDLDELLGDFQILDEAHT
jgi:hypothetical protein